jgi:hypothetical protein
MQEREGLLAGFVPNLNLPDIEQLDPSNLGA